MSVYTRRLATDTLSSLGSAGKPLDLSLINETALLAQERARKATALLAGINATLGGVVSIVLSSTEQLRERALVSTSTSRSQSTLSTSSDLMLRLLCRSVSVG